MSTKEVMVSFDIDEDHFTLADAQDTVAYLSGFQDWAVFAVETAFARECIIYKSFRSGYVVSGPHEKKFLPLIA